MEIKNNMDMDMIYFFGFGNEGKTNLLNKICNYYKQFIRVYEEKYENYVFNEIYVSFVKKQMILTNNIELNQNDNLEKISNNFINYLNSKKWSHDYNFQVKSNKYVLFISNDKSYHVEWLVQMLYVLYKNKVNNIFIVNTKKDCKNLCVNSCLFYKFNEFKYIDENEFYNKILNIEDDKGYNMYYTYWNE